MRSQLKNELDYGIGSIRNKDISPSIIFPHIRLGHAILKQAIVELKDMDPLVAIPALAWWLDDGADWLHLLDLDDANGGDYLSKLIGGCTNGKNNKIS